MLKGVFQFLKSKLFVKNLVIYLITVGLLLWLILTWLNSSTSHNEVIKVPDFKNIKVGKLDDFISGKNLRYLVIDSIYDAKAAKGVVIKQEPEAGAEVKENRTIYLYITSVMPPSIEMPKLVDRSLRQALSMIETYGLKVGKIKFVPDQCANCVLEQLVKGKKIAPGQLVAKGTVIYLVVGKGLSDEEVGVPCLYGLSRKDAIAKLSENSLSVGVIFYDEPKDSAISLVYRQTPSCGKGTINMGATVDLFLTSNKSKVPAVVKDSVVSNDDDGDD